MKKKRRPEMHQAQIGIFGGTGFYSLLDNVEEIDLKTPYGPPSDKIALATHKGKKLAFIPRHGKTHSIPPHKINYRANVHAMKQLGVTQILSPAAAGSLQRHIKPGDFVVTDQYIDRTTGRADTFYDGPEVTHMPGAEPFCPELRIHVINALKELNLPHHETGTALIIQGPRFSTKAESKWFTGAGWDLINMTMYPEALLAREKEIAYTNISLITDYDAGFDGEFPAVDAQAAVKVFLENIEKLKQLVFLTIEKIDPKISCTCHTALKRARF